MYNLFVTAQRGAWDKTVYECGRSRVIHGHTHDDLRARYENLDDSAIAELLTLPCLFAYEQVEDLDARIGWLTRVRNGNRVRIEFKIDPAYPPIPPERITELSMELDLNGFEMGHTHWAVKEVDLVSVLANAGVIPNRPQLQRVEDIEFPVALSFPGEKRTYVAEVASELKSLLGLNKVFYDFDFQAQLARPNLDTFLQAIYNRSRLIAVFLCEEYETKEWCGLEFRVVRDLIKKREHERVMFLRFDDADVQGVFSTDGYIDANDHDPPAAARFIAERVALTSQLPPGQSTSALAQSGTVSDEAHSILVEMIESGATRMTLASLVSSKHLHFLNGSRLNEELEVAMPEFVEDYLDELVEAGFLRQSNETFFSLTRAGKEYVGTKTN